MIGTVSTVPPATEFALKAVGTRKYYLTPGEGLTLTVLGVLADAALNSAQGYNYNTTTDVNFVTGYSTGTIKRHIRRLIQLGLVVDMGHGNYRISEDAFNR